jgi:hypothetical protein
MAFTLHHVPEKKRGFLPLEILFLLTENDDYLFTEVRYEKKQVPRVDTDKFLSGSRKQYFRDGTEHDNFFSHRAKRRKACTWKTLPRLYQNICKEYAAFDICSLLTPSGYKYYCDIRSPTYHHLSYSLLMMFYIGTAARYRPLEISELLNSDMRPLISEALAIIPGQVLYHLVGLCTQRTCVVPFAAITS